MAPIAWASPRSRRLSDAKIIFDGNSITAWEDSSAVGKWPDRLKLLPPYNSPTCNFVNMGQPGASTWNLAARAPAIIDPLLEPGRLTMLCVWETINDLGQFPGSPQRNAENLRDYCLARRSRGFKVVVFGLQGARVAPGGITSQGAFNEARPVINTWLANNWRSFADAFVNPSDSQKLNNCLPADVPDGIHPSGVALNELLPLVDRALKSIIL